MAPMDADSFAAKMRKEHKIFIREFRELTRISKGWKPERK